MGRRMKVGALTAAILGLLTLAVGWGAFEGGWRLALQWSASGLEVSAASENVRVALTL